MIDRIIPTAHKEWLCRVLGIESHCDLPENVVAKYWARKQLLDRLRIEMVSHDAIEIVEASGGVMVQQTEEERRRASVVWAFENKRIQVGDEVQYLYRDKMHRGKILGISRDRKLVEIQDEKGAERKFPEENVSIPSAA